MSKRAFTLIELLVVITIISIITLITVAQFTTARKKANDVARKGDLNSVSKALQMYFTDYGYFPPTSEIVWGSSFEDNASTPYTYMKVLPIENYTTTPYCYKISTDGKKYGLFAQLENTTDKDCSAILYNCGGKTYCYGIVSPNTSLTEMSALP